MKPAAAVVFLLAGAFLAWRLSVAVDSATELLNATRQVIATLPGKVDALQRAADAQITAARGETAYQVDALRAQLVDLGNHRSAEALALLDRRIGQGIGVLDARTAYMASTIGGLRSDLQPILMGAAAVVADLHESTRLFPELARNGLGAVAAVKVTAGETAQTMRVVRDAVPGVLKGVEAFEANSNETTAYSAALLKNLATATRPLPWWARVGLAVAPPIAQTGFTIASWASIKGK